MLGSKEPPIGNGIWAIKRSRDRWRHDPKGAVVLCCRLSSLCIVAKRCVLEQNVLTAYRKSYNNEKSIGTKMNDLDLCLEVVSRSCQPLHYTRCWIYRKLLEIDAWFQRTTNRKWYICYQMFTWPMTSWPQRCCGAVLSAILATDWLLVFFILFQFSDYF